MNQAVLTFDSESGDKDYKIAWKKIAYIKTYNKLRLTMNKREVIIAHISDDDPSDNQLKVYNDETGLEQFITYDQILNFQKVSDDFWGKVNMNLNLGYNYAKSTNTHQLSLRSGASYLANRWGFNGSYDEFYTLIDTVQSRRLEAFLGSEYLLPSSWYWIASSNWFSSDEQKLALRTTFVGGFGRYLLNDPAKTLQIAVGAALNQERFQQNEINNKESIELLFNSSYRLYDHKFFDISSNGTAFLNTAERDRYRASFSLDLGWDLAGDFDLVWGYSLNFDSKPPNGGEQSDYVISLTLGWAL